MASDRSKSGASRPAIDPNLVYFNGIDAETGMYAMPPKAIDDLARNVRVRPGIATIAELHGEVPRSFAAPFGLDLTNVAEAGWAIVLAEETPREVSDALVPLIEHRRKQAGPLFKVLAYKKGEQVRDWYRRHQIAAGTFAAENVPYFLLLAGPPTAIPFDFQYLMGVE